MWSLIDLYSSHLNDKSAEIISLFLIPSSIYSETRCNALLCTIKHCCLNVELNIYIRHISMTDLQRLSVHFWYLHLFTQKPDVMHYYVRIKHCCVNVELNRSIFVTSQWRICRDYQYIFDIFIYLLRNQM